MRERTWERGCHVQYSIHGKELGSALLRQWIKNIRIKRSHDCGFIAYSRISTLESVFKKLGIRMPDSPSSETQGQIIGARESLNGRKNIYGTKKSKERREEPLGTMSYQTSFKRSPPFWLLIGARKRVFSLVPTICPWVSEDADSPDTCGRKPYPERKSCGFKNIRTRVDGA